MRPLAEYLFNNRVPLDLEIDLQRYCAACEIIDRLRALPINPEQKQYLEALSNIVSDYEDPLK
jgi:hypothetical protein